MKPRLYERALTAVYALFGVALCALMIASVASAPVREWILAFFSRSNGSLLETVLFIAAMAILAVWGLFVIYVSLKFNRSRHTGFVSVQNSENGDVLISVPALHSLASKAVANIEGVACKDVRVVEHPDSISLRLRMTIKGDHNIPNTTAEMQRAIRSHIETHSGIAVREVKIVITDIVTAPEMFVSKAVVPAQNEAPVEEIYYESEPVVREAGGESEPEFFDEAPAEPQPEEKGDLTDGNEG